jgi:hypothetical protein
MRGAALYGPDFLPKPDVADRYRKELGVKLPEVLALAPDNDPYNIGTPAHLRDAYWFVDLWEQLGGRQGFHLRRLHYAYLITMSDPTRPDGKRYTGTANDFDELCKAAVKARYLRLVDPWQFEDRKADVARHAADAPKPAEISAHMRKARSWVEGRPVSRVEACCSNR